MAQHDPVQDEVNRQIREGTLTERRGRSPFFRGAIANRLRSAALEKEAPSFATKGDPGPALSGETPRGRRFLLAQAAQIKSRIEAPGRLRAQQQALEEVRANAKSKRLLQDRTGQSRLALGNAALAKARGGNIGDEGLAALGFSPEEVNRFSGNISPTTARTASTSRSQVKAAAIREDSNEVARQQKRIDNQRQNNIRNNQAKIREDRQRAQAEIAALDKGLQSTSPEDIQKIKEVFDRLTKGAAGVPLPADQVETYKAAAKVNLPADATEEELGEEATRLAEEDGFAFAQ